jgi:hypothetical protein
MGKIATEKDKSPGLFAAYLEGCQLSLKQGKANTKAIAEAVRLL